MTTIDRRAFVLGISAIAAACSREGAPGAGSVAGEAPLGVQLYTVRNLMAMDVAATLDLVASVGFSELEFAGYFGHSPAELRRLLDASGLAPVSAHIGRAEFAADAGSVIEYAAELGHEYLVVPFLADNERSLDDYRRHAEDFNRWGEACAEAGIQFAYHNHMFEFDETNGVIPYDLLLNETDPDLVKMELDFCWGVGAGADVLAYFDAWPGRFPLCHLKDFANGADVDIGDGIVDFDAVLAGAETAGMKHGFVERDLPEDAEASIRAGYDRITPVWGRSMRVSAGA
jgi:sugar phosphate isomerase/epimerase